MFELTYQSIIFWIINETISVPLKTFSSFLRIYRTLKRNTSLGLVPCHNIKLEILTFRPQSQEVSWEREQARKWACKPHRQKNIFQETVKARWKFSLWSFIEDQDEWTIALLRSIGSVKVMEDNQGGSTIVFQITRNSESLPFLFL